MRLRLAGIGDPHGGDQDSAGLQQPPGPRLHLPAQRVEHDVHVPGRVLEPPGAVVQEAVRTPALHQRAGPGGRRGGHVRAQRVGDLHRHPTDVAARRVHEQPRARLQAALAHDALPGRQRPHRHRRRGVEVQRRRLPRQRRRVQDRILGVSAGKPGGHHGVHRVTRLEASNTLAHRLHHPGHVLPGGGGERHVQHSLQVALAQLPVHRVHRRRVDAHQDLARPGIRALNLLKLQHGRAAVLVEPHRHHGCHWTFSSGSGQQAAAVYV